MRFGIGFIAPLGRSRSRRYMFIGDVNMWRSFVVGQDHEEREERDDVHAPQPAVRVAAACSRDQRRRGRRAGSRRTTTSRTPGRPDQRDAEGLGEEAGDPDDEERAEDHRVLGLGLDADAVRAAGRSGGRSPTAMPTRKTTPSEVADDEYAWYVRPCRNFSDSGQLVVDLEHHRRR